MPDGIARLPFGQPQFIELLQIQLEFRTGAEEMT